MNVLLPPSRRLSTTTSLPEQVAAASLEAQAWDRSDLTGSTHSHHMRILPGAADVPEGLEFIEIEAVPLRPARGGMPTAPGAPGGMKDMTVSQEPLEWLTQCCGLRWQNMTQIVLKLATSRLFLPRVEKGENPIEDAAV